MGPHFFKCGKFAVGVSADARRGLFNGAALFQVRKADNYGERCNQPYNLQWGRTFSSAERRASRRRLLEGELSSMGPHFFKCGKCFTFTEIDQPLTTLQWGRTFSSAERCDPNKKKKDYDYSSMGPHFFKCGKRGGRRYRALDRASSMGPHFFKCGKSRANGSAAPAPARLQWGRTFSSAERIVHPLLRRFAFRSSMGPHFFKCGKIVPSGRLNGFRIFFNGAALFQVRKVLEISPSSINKSCLQWGRTFSSAESASRQ